MKLFTKFVLPNAVEFIRYVNDLMYLNHKKKNDTSTYIDPILTRAKNLTDKKSVVVTVFERKT